MSTILRRSSRSWMHGISRTRLPMSLWSPSSILAKYFSGMKWVYASMRMEGLRRGLRRHWTRGRPRYMPVTKSAAQGGREREKTHHAGRVDAPQLGALVYFGVDQPDVPDHLSRSGQYFDRRAGDQKGVRLRLRHHGGDL